MMFSRVPPRIPRRIYPGISAEIHATVFVKIAPAVVSEISPGIPSFFPTDFFPEDIPVITQKLLEECLK